MTSSAPAPTPCGLARPSHVRSSQDIGTRLRHALQVCAAGLLLGLMVLGCADDEERIARFLERGQAYVEEGKDQEAIIEFKNVLQIDPEHPVAHESLSLAFLRSEKPREAYWEMSETVRVDPDNTEARLRYGTISAAIGDFDLSLEQAEAVLALDSNSARAYTMRGQARETREDFDEAEADFRAAAEAEPEAAAFHFLLAGFLERRGRYEEAEVAYRRLLEVEETYLAATALVRVLLRDESRRDEVDALAERILVLADEAPREPFEIPDGEPDRGTTSLRHNMLRESALRGAYLMKAVLLRDSGDFDAAIAVLQEGVSKSDSKVEIIYQMANFYRTAGRPEDENRMILLATEEAPDNANAQLVLSAYLGAKGDLDGSLKAAQVAVAVDPENRSAQLREAEILIDISVRDEDPSVIQRSRTIVEGVLEAAPESPEAHFVKAKIELAEQDPEAARTSLETTLQARPDWAQARYVLGSTLAASGDLARARAELEAAIELEPQLTEARRLLTQVYARLGEHEFAIDQGRSYLRARPGDTGVLIIVGQSLSHLGRIEEAYEEISEIPDEERDMAALFALGRIDLAFGRIDEGAENLRRADELSPGNPQVLRSLLAIDLRRGEIEASIERITRALVAHPESSDIVELDAEVKRSAGDVEGARKAFERAVELEPRNVSAQLALAQLALREGDQEGMVKVVERAAAALPESSDLQYRLAMAYQQTGRNDEAIAAYDKSISLNSDLALAKNNLAYLLAESGGDLDRALDLARQAKEQLPEDGNAADTLGWVLLKRGLPSAAIGYLEEAAERVPEDAYEIQGIVHNHLADAYEQNAEPEKAIAESRATIEISERLSKSAAERGLEANEPEWAKEAKARVERLTSSS